MPSKTEPVDETGIEICRLSDEGFTRHTRDELTGLLAQGGLVWADMGRADDMALDMLRNSFGLAEKSVMECTRMSPVPRFRAESDHVFFTLHSLDGEGHLLEIDHFIGKDYLITVHNTRADVTREALLRETNLVRGMLEEGRSRPQTSRELAAEIMSAIAQWLEDYLEDIAARAGQLDRKMRTATTGGREDFLGLLYGIRHELVTIRNRASQSTQSLTQLAMIVDTQFPEGGTAFRRLADRFASLRIMCENERDFVQGVLDYYESIVQTKMNVAMERLALIAYLLIPFTLAVGFWGMEIVAPGNTNLGELMVTLVLVVIGTYLVHRWTKKRGWW